MSNILKTVEKLYWVEVREIAGDIVFLTSKKIGEGNAQEIYSSLLKKYTLQAGFECLLKCREITTINSQVKSSLDSACSNVRKPESRLG